MKKLQFYIILCGVLFGKISFGQDPAFAQYFSSPLNLNPALAGNINSEWRFISNLRNQWQNPSSPYVTGTVSFDKRILQSKDMYKPQGKNVIGLGGMLMMDQAMGGIVKSNYASLNLSYSLTLSDDVVKQKLGIGFGATYGSRNIDFHALDFEEQFTGKGFDVNLPTGETALSNMKGYVSANTGLTYSVSNENSNFDFGVAAFHVNKPKQTYLNDPNQYLAIRKVVHANFETYLSNILVFNANAVHQFQNQAKYTSVGAIFGYYLPVQSGMVINAGAWYWMNNAIIPYLGIAVKDFQFGISYDITTSRLTQALQKPRSFELTFILRGKKDPVGIQSYPDVLSYPWK